jgi:hypothetical protein
MHVILHVNHTIVTINAPYLQCYSFLLRSEFFFRTTREIEYFFFFFFQNLTLDYMTKTLNQISFFSSTKIRIFCSATWGIRRFFLEKTHKNFNVLFVAELGRSKKIMIIWNQRIVKKGLNKKLSVYVVERAV